MTCAANGDRQTLPPRLPAAAPSFSRRFELRLLGSSLQAKNDPQSVPRVLHIIRLLRALGDNACSLESGARSTS